MNICYLQFIDPELIEVEKENTPEQMKYIKPVVLARAVMTVSYVENADNKDAEAIAKTALVPAHHPCIGMLKLYNLLISPYLIKTR